MSDIEQALAEAQPTTWETVEARVDDDGTYRDVVLDRYEVAVTLAATEPMQALAREAAVGRAVQEAIDEGKSLLDIARAATAAAQGDDDE